MAQKEHKGGGLRSLAATLLDYALPDDGTDDNKPQAAEAAPAPAVAVPHAPVNPVRPAGGSEVDQQFFDQISREVNSADSQLYIDFQSNLQAMASVIPDLRTRYAAAFKVLQTRSGATAAELIETLDNRLKTLETEKANFSSEADRRVADIEAKARTHLDQVSQSLHDLDEQISRLQAQRSAKAGEQQGINAQLERDKQDIEERRARFLPACDAVHQSIEDEKRQITSFLGAN